MIATCPDWAEWLDERHVSVKCKTCTCVYTDSYVGHSGKVFGGVPKRCTSCVHAKREVARKALPLDQALVDAVKAHAHANYDRGGWDYVVETYTDAEVWEVIAGSKTAAGAVKKMAAVARLLDDRRSDVQSTVW
jgi:hypothetical protein